jgi:centrosomal protein CEP76
MIRRTGDHIDHALLLASLLLGLGLDAYVALGTKDKHDGVYAWVLSRSSPSEVVCWDAITGTRHAIPYGAATATNGAVGGAAAQQASQLLDFVPYRKIHCVFNDRNVWANVQRDDSLRATDFSLETPTLWKSMNAAVIAALSAHQTAGATGTSAAAAVNALSPLVPSPSLVLRASRLNVFATEQAIEMYVQAPSLRVFLMCSS